MRLLAASTATALVLALSRFAHGQEFTLSKEEHLERDSPYSPYVGDYLPQNVYFGDTHLHTS